MEAKISPQQLRLRVSYNAQTGDLTWRARTADDFLGGRYPADRLAQSWNAKHAGKPAFSTDNGRGYCRGKLMGQDLLAHRVAWAIHYGAWPIGELDHINGNPKDNRLSNLRECTRAQNLQNLSGSRKAASHFKGVFRDGGRWSARIRAGGRNHHIGSFATEAEAARAYDAAARIHHGEFARTNQSLGLFNQENAA